MRLQQATRSVQRFIMPLWAMRRRFGLKWKIISGSIGGVLMFGVVGLGLVRYELGGVLRTQLDRRASDIAANLGDGAANYILRGDVLELYALVTKYSFLNGVAYAFIVDRDGKIATHSLGAFPSELHASLSVNDRRQAGRRELAFEGKAVYETRAPILEGQVGTVYVGIWRDAVEEEIQRALLPLLVFMAIALVASVILTMLITRRIIGPVLRLKEIADQVSMGDLERPVSIKSHDEIGDLALSLDRLRSSLKAAMVRLSRT